MKRSLLKLYAAYLFIIPGVSMISYELYRDDLGLERDMNIWSWLFFLPVVMHIGFGVSTLDASKSLLSIVWMLVRVPIGIITMTLAFDWDLLFAFSVSYGLEVFGFTIGMFIGALLRSANISFLKRLISIGVVGLISVLVYARFHLVLDDYIQWGQGSWLEVTAGILFIFLSVLPFIRVFVKGRVDRPEDEKVPPVFKNTTPAIAISAVLYSFILPMITHFMMEGF